MFIKKVNLLIMLTAHLMVLSGNQILHAEERIWTTTEIGIVIRPNAEIYDRPDSEADILHTSQLWDWVFVIEGRWKKAEKPPLTPGSYKIDCEKVILPSGTIGWIRCNHILKINSSELYGEIKRDGVPLYSLLPGGEQVASKDKHKQFYILEAKIKKMDHIISFFYKVIFTRKRDDVQDKVRQGWIYGDDVELFPYKAWIHTGMELYTQNHLGGAEQVFKWIFDKCPDELFVDTDDMGNWVTNHTGATTLYWLSRIYVKSKKYQQAVTFLEQMKTQYADQPVLAGNKSAPVAQEEIAEIYYKHLKDWSKALSIYHEIIKLHSGERKEYVEGYSYFDILALYNIEKMGNNLHWTSDEKLAQYQKAITNSNHPLLKAIATIKRALILRKEKKYNQVVDELYAVIHTNPSAEEYVYKGRVDYNISALKLLIDICVNDLHQPEEAMGHCRKLVARHRENNLGKAALFLRAQTLDETTGNREQVITVYDLFLKNIQEWGRSYYEFGFDEQKEEKWIGSQGAKKRLEEIRLFKPRTASVIDSVSLLGYPAPDAQKIKDLNQGIPMTVLYKKEMRIKSEETNQMEKKIWVKVSDEEGSIGWIDETLIRFDRQILLDPSEEYTTWPAETVSEFQTRYSSGKPVQNPEVKGIIENVYANEVLFCHVNQDSVPDIIVCGFIENPDYEYGPQDIAAFDGRTGSILWKYEAQAYFGEYMPVIDNGNLYCIYHHDIFNLNVFSGTLIWDSQVNESIRSAPLISGDLLLVVCHIGRGPQPSKVAINCFDKKIGTKLWSEVLEGRFISTPCFRNNSLILGIENRIKSGEKISVKRYVVCFDIRRRKIDWKYQTDWAATSPIIVYQDKVLFEADRDYFYALKINNGNLVWRCETEDYVETFPAIKDSLICLVSESGTISAVNSNTGHMIWKVEMNTKFKANPCIVGNVLYAGGENGYLYAWSLDSGELLWEYDMTSPIISGISAAGPVLAVITDTHKLYLIGNKKESGQYTGEDSTTIGVQEASGQKIEEDMTAAEGKPGWKKRITQWIDFMSRLFKRNPWLAYLCLCIVALILSLLIKKMFIRRNK